MKRAAIGVRMHSGWGALVAVSNSVGAVEVLERRRIVTAPAGTPGTNQPYHFAENLNLPEAEKFLRDYFAASKSLALIAIRDVSEELQNNGYSIVALAVLLAAGRPLPSLRKILGSHALIHAAEGELFREAFTKACECLNLLVVGVSERALYKSVEDTFGGSAIKIRQQVSTLGRSLGPPWAKDQKAAALAALTVLASAGKQVS
jgi:hypothetical protein